MRLDRERRAAAAEARLSAMSFGGGGGGGAGACCQCGKALGAMTPFTRLSFSYCSPGCAAQHKQVRLYTLNTEP